MDETNAKYVTSAEVVVSPQITVQSIRGSAPPASAFAPFVKLEEDNAWLFLLDKQHESWQDEVQADWHLRKDWKMAESIPARMLEGLLHQRTCLTYEVRLNGLWARVSSYGHD